MVPARLLISILRQVYCNQLYSTSIEQVKCMGWGWGHRRGYSFDGGEGGCFRVGSEQWFPH